MAFFLLLKNKICDIFLKVFYEYFSLRYYKAINIFKFATLGGRSPEIFVVTCTISVSWYDHFYMNYNIYCYIVITFLLLFCVFLVLQVTSATWKICEKCRRQRLKLYANICLKFCT